MNLTLKNNIANFETSKTKSGAPHRYRGISVLNSKLIFLYLFATMYSFAIANNNIWADPTVIVRLSCVAFGALIMVSPFYFIKNQKEAEMLTTKQKSKVDAFAQAIQNLTDAISNALNSPRICGYITSEYWDEIEAKLHEHKTAASECNFLIKEVV